MSAETFTNGGYRVMKHRKSVLVRLIVAAYVISVSPAAQTQQSVGPASITEESSSGVNSPLPIVPKPVKHSRNPVLQGNFPNIKGATAKELGATSAIVQQEVHKAGALDDWLIVLAVFGLIVLQLRHKHKSLPQRRITPYV